MLNYTTPEIRDFHVDGVAYRAQLDPRGIGRYWVVTRVHDGSHIGRLQWTQIEHWAEEAAPRVLAFETTLGSARQFVHGDRAFLAVPVETYQPDQGAWELYELRTSRPGTVFVSWEALQQRVTHKTNGGARE